jgi:hypothetical protein
VGPTCERRLHHEVRPHHAIFSQENPQAEIWIDAIYCMRLVVDSFSKEKRKMKKILNGVGLKLLCTTKSLLCLIHL